MAENNNQKSFVSYVLGRTKNVVFASCFFFFNILPPELKKGSMDSLRSYKLYWVTYGGHEALLRSPYIFIAVIFSICVTMFGDGEWNWSSDTKAIIACTLGFSFAGYSLMLGMAGVKFIKHIKGKFSDGKPSPLMVVAASFTHFFVVQCMTLMWAIFSSAFGVQKIIFVKFIGIFFLVYSMFVLLASALAALNFVSWYNNHPDDE